MDEAVDVVFGDSFGYPLSTPDMDIVKVKVPGLSALGF
jgi:hypothetical protein